MVKSSFLKGILLIILIILIVGIIGFVGYNTQSNSKTEVRILVGHETKSETAQKAKVIVEGKVEEIEKVVKINRNHNIPEIDVTIKVDNIYKGSPKNKNEVVVRTNKTYSEKETTAQFPIFEKNEKVLLFLSEDDGEIADKSKDYYIVTGVNQGKYTYDDKKKQYTMDRGNEIEVYNKGNLKEEIAVEQNAKK